MMAFSYDIKIYEKNETTIINPNVFVDTTKLDESLDDGVIVIPRLTRKKPFARFSRVRIKVYNNLTLEKTIDYLIYGVEVEINGKSSSTKYYNHTLGLIEPIKWFEKFQCGSLTFRQPLREDRVIKTLYDYVERLRDLVPFVPLSILSETRLFAIDSELETRLKEIDPAPEIFLEEKNLREALIAIFEVINAIPRIVYDESYSRWKLTADYVNQKNLNFDIESNIIDYKKSADGENLAQASDIFHSNTVPSDKDNENVVYSSSITEYVSLRSNEIIVGENNWNIKLDYLVSELKAISILTEQGETDLFDYCIEKAVFDTKELDNGVGSKSHLFYWQYKNNEISGFNSGFGAVYQNLSIENILESLGKTVDGDKYMFKITYIPYIDKMRSKQFRIDREPYELTPDMFDTYSSININQQERVNELYDLTNNIYGMIQRLGVDTVSMSKKHYTTTAYDPTTNPNGIYSIGDYTEDNYVVTKVEIVYYRMFVVARYELSKNFNRIAQFIQIDKEFRPYDIALTGRDISLKRDIITPIAFVEVSDTEEDAIVKYNDLQDNFMKTFENTESELPYTIGSILASNGLSFSLANATVRPLMLLGEKNIIKFKIDFDDTKLAGKTRIKNIEENLSYIGVGLNSAFLGQKNLQIAKNYTMDDGQIGYAKLFLLKELFTETDNYEVNYFKSLMLPQVYNEMIWDYNDETNGKKSLAFIQNELNTEPTLIYVFAYDTYTDMINGGNLGSEILYYYTRDTEQLWFYQFGEGFLNPSGVELLSIETNDVFYVDTYGLKKDRSEILGLEMVIPILPAKDKVNNFIIGDYLVKNNALLKPLDSVSGNRLYCQPKTTYFSQNDTKELELLTTDYPVTIGENYIDIPSYIYENYDYFGLVNENNELYLGINQRNADGSKTEINRVYFNLLDSLSSPVIIVDNDYILERELDISIGITTELSTQQNYIVEPEISISINASSNQAFQKAFVVQPNIVLSMLMNSQATQRINQEIIIQPSIVMGLTANVQANIQQAYRVTPTIQLGLLMNSQATQRNSITVIKQVSASLPILLTTQLNKSELRWNYMSSQTTEPTGLGYINGGTDVNVSETVTPSESPYNYTNGDIVYYNDGEISPTTYYIYEVLNVLL